MTYSERPSKIAERHRRVTQFAQSPSRFGSGHGLTSPCFQTYVILFGAIHVCTHAGPLLRIQLSRPIAFKQYGSERLPVHVDPLPAQGFNFNNVHVVTTVTILGDKIEDSMVCRMALGRDSEGAFLFCLPFLVPPLILLRVSFGNRHDMCLKETRLKQSGAIHFHTGCSTDRRRARCRSRIKMMCTILHVGRSVSRRCSFSVPLLRHLTNQTTQIFQGKQPPP